MNDSPVAPQPWTPPDNVPLPPWASGRPAVEVADDDDEDEIEDGEPPLAGSGPADYTVDDGQVWIALDGMLFRFPMGALMTYRWD